jgi:Actin
MPEIVSNPNLDESSKVVASEKSSSRRKRSTTGSVGVVKKAKECIIVPPPSHVLLVDNGGDSLKFGILDVHETCISMPNITARLKHQWKILVGDEVLSVQASQIQSITRSTERGCITNMGNQIQVWKRMLELLRVHIPLHGDAAESFGWKVSKQPKPTSIYAPSTMAVVILVPPLCPRTILENILQVWFQDFGFAHVGILTSQAFATHPTSTECCTVVDLGWSASHIIPMYQEQILKSGIRRLPLGGRHLVGLWKYYCSYRQWNLMDEELLLDDVHKQLSFVSLDFNKDLATARKHPLGRRPFDREFVLPDFQTVYRGYVRLTPWFLKQENDELKTIRTKSSHETEHFREGSRIVNGEQGLSDEVTNQEDVIECNNGENSTKGDLEPSLEVEGDPEPEESDDVDSEDETDDQKRMRIMKQRAEEEKRRQEIEAERQVLLVSVERFTIPEILFRPSDAELGNMPGLPRAICDAIDSSPKIYHSALYENIHLIGGITNLPNLVERLRAELRCIVPIDYNLCIQAADDPINETWTRARNWLQQNHFGQWSVPRGQLRIKEAVQQLLNHKHGKLV